MTSGPNFLLIGTTKAGTSSIYHYLRDHPDVFMSAVKEPHYFAYAGQKPAFGGPHDMETFGRMVVTDRAAYEQLFAGVNAERARGEASAMYLYEPQAAERIHAYDPRMKLIAVLRDPVERAYSAYTHLRREFREPLDDFMAALNAELQRKAESWVPLYHYEAMGYYARQLERYLALFPREQIWIGLYDDFRRDNEAFLQSICRFLEIDDAFRPDTSITYNKSGIPKRAWLHRALRSSNPLKSALRGLLPRRLRRRMVVAVRNSNLEQAPPMPAEARAYLSAAYRDDVAKLSQLIDRDLSAWL